MSVVKFDPHQLEGFIVHNPKAVAAKLRRFTASSTHIVADWDRTLTANGRGRDITTWGVMQELLPLEAQESENRTYAHYHPKELAGIFTEQEALDWWSGSLNLHVKHGLNIHDMERAINKINLRPRAGAVELLDFCKKAGMPTVILSAGVRNVIEWVVQKYGMEPSVILATHLNSDETGRVISWDKQTMIHALNKHEAGHRELSIIRQKQPHAILLGDTIKDAYMVEGDENVLRIRVCDTHPSESPAETKAFREASFAVGFDLIVSDDLHPVVKLAEWLADKQ